MTVAPARGPRRFRIAPRTLMRRCHPLWQLFLARMREFYREPMVLVWVYVFPLFLALGLGVAFSGALPDVLDVDIQAPEVDIERAPAQAETAALRQHLRADGLKVQYQSEEAARRRLRDGKTALVIVPTAQGYRYLYDPTRPESLMARYRVDDMVQRWKAGGATWHTEDDQVKEPGNRYIDFLIPGLMGLNLMGGGLWGVGFVIVDMRVRKLLKRLLTTPMRRSDFLLSVVGSRLVFLVPEMLLLALAGRLGFGMPIRGNPLTLALVLLVGGATFSGLGLLLACRTEKTETIAGLINLLMVPLWMISGTFFSAKRFPDFLQPLIQASPLTHLNDILREVMLQGASLGSVAPRLALLCGWTGVTYLLALKWFRWH